MKHNSSKCRTPQPVVPATVTKATLPAVLPAGTADQALVPVVKPEPATASLSAPSPLSVPIVTNAIPGTLGSGESSQLSHWLGLSCFLQKISQDPLRSFLAVFIFVLTCFAAYLMWDSIVGWGERLCADK